MKVKVRNAKGDIFIIDGVSKAMLVQDFRKKVHEAAGIEPKLQRLFYRGKQLEDDCDLLDYKIEMGFIIDVTERVYFEPLDKAEKNKSKTDQIRETENLFDGERNPDAPAAGQSNPSSSRAQARPTDDKNIDSIRELCPELAKEIEEQLKQEEEKKGPNCGICKDNPSRKCKECACSICGGKDLPDTQLFCEQCEYVTHMHCLTPPLTTVPEDDWYCPDCYNDTSEIVNCGEKGSKFSKKNSKMPSRQAAVSKKKDGTDRKVRDWGKGLATAGRTKTCTLVPINHFGPIPGVEVGMAWRYRIQVSEEGIHRPPVSGIAGRAEEGCMSIVLAGGYVDDTDLGNEFYYSGCGGRDLSGNKRTAEQSFDQVLDKRNLSIARNCDAPIDKVNGNTAKNWKKGKPIRVVRSEKYKKVSKFAPLEGNRYDGIYKVVKYWPEKGRSGFIVWRYLMRRDDPAPAPWEKKAKKFKCIHPEIEKTADSKKRKAEDEDKSKSKKNKKGESKTQEEVELYVVEDDVLKILLKDEKNANLWKECTDFKTETKLEWYNKVQEVFQCVVCQSLLEDPVTMPCAHNICKGCLVRSFKSEIYTCSYCRHELGKDYKMAVNPHCSKALKTLFCN